jgi:ABC-type glycerol-3-phosphate transport system substrate-binding protein
MPQSNKLLRALFRSSLWMCLLLTACNPKVESTLPESTPSQMLPSSLPPTITPQPEASPQTIVVWVPPMLASDSVAGTLLSEHLSAFEAAHSTISIRVRVKEESGTSGLLETLTAADFAAPSTRPDLIAFDPTSLNAAALKSLIMPLDEFIDPPRSPEWYDHAVTAAYVDGTFFGLPFLSEAEAFAYRKEAFPSEPKSWANLLDATDSFLFPAGDEGSTFTLVQYLALGGELEDGTGHPFIDPDLLEEIFDFYISAEEAGLLPLYTLQLQTTSDTWKAFQEGNASSATVPLQAYFSEDSDDSFKVIPWPTRDSSGVVPVRTFSWAVVAKDYDQEGIGELLDWLIEPGFLGSLAHSLGSLPVTMAALAQWPESETSPVVSRLLRASSPQPTGEVSTTFGPLIQAALQDVLNEKSTPKEAALAVSEQIGFP